MYVSTTLKIKIYSKVHYANFQFLKEIHSHLNKWEPHEEDIIQIKIQATGLKLD